MRAAFALLLLCACSAAHEPPAPSPRRGAGLRGPAPGEGAEGRGGGLAAEPRLPIEGDRWSPALVEVVGAGAIDGRALADDAQQCAACHADAVAQWRASVHAFASFNNPIYRASVDGFREGTKDLPTASRFCAGCHDLPLLFDGAMDAPVEPDDVRAHGGVTCLSCHSIERARVDGNGSYTWRSDPVPLPKEGDAASLQAHLARVKPQRNAELCASCHRAFLGPETGNGHHFGGADDLGPWLRSAYAGGEIERVDEPIAKQDCRGCHMPRERAPLGDVAADNGTIASHRFPGGHSWLAAMRGDDVQLARVGEMLRRAASIDLAAVAYPDGRRAFPADGAELAPGQPIDLEVVVKNRGTGHHFPGGTRDAHDAWIELAVRSAAGELLAEAGAEQQASGTDPTAHRLRALIVGEGGEPVLAREVHRFRAPVYDRTLAPRDAELVRYRLALPPDLPSDAWPLTVTARLRHRSRSLEIQRAACEAARSERGQAFAQIPQNAGDPVLDPCRPQPVLDLATATALLFSLPPQGRGAPGPRARPGSGGSGRGSPPDDRLALAARLVDHGTAWSHALQEQLDAARPSLEQALHVLDGEPDSFARARLRAAALVQLARVAGRQGRPDEALALADLAEQALPAAERAHPAIAWARGKALYEVWRFPEAAPWLERAAASAPGNDAAWTALAITLGSAGRHDEALVASARGLELAPRSPDLLRVQALGLRALAPDTPAMLRAWDAFLDHRVRDDAPGLRAKCSNRVPGCALERVPVHRHELRLR